MSNGKRSSTIIAALATLLVLLALLAACGGPEPTAQVQVDTATIPPTQEVVATNTQPPPPTDTPTIPPSTDTPTIPPSTDTPVPATLTPTPEPPADTPLADTPTPTTAPTDTPMPDTPTPVPTRRPTNTPEITYPAPTLLAPLEKDAESLHGQVTFRWDYPRPLNENEAFQVLVWKEGQPHWGVAELWTGTEQVVDLDAVLPLRAGTGEYLWTVVVLEKGTGRVLSSEATPWRLVYVGDPCASCDCNSQCRDDKCADCCKACCGGCE